MMEFNIKRIVLGMLLKGLLLSTPVAVAATIVEGSHPSITQPAAYSLTFFDSLSETQQNKLLLYWEVLKQNLSVDDYFKLAEITECESGWLHYKDGKILVSSTNDVGFGQINQINFKEAESLGYDINKLTDNIGYLVWKYSKEGPRPWVCSYLRGIL